MKTLITRNMISETVSIRYLILCLYEQHRQINRLFYKMVAEHQCYRSLRSPAAKVGMTLHWRHNDHGGVSNHQPHDCLLNRLFRRRSKKTPKLRVIGLCAGNSPGPVNSPHKWPVKRKMFPFDDVIMSCTFGHKSIFLHGGRHWPK